MAGATLRAVLGQPTTLLVVQYRHALPWARTHSPAREGWPHCGHPSRLSARNHHRHWFFTQWQPNFVPDWSRALTARHCFSLPGVSWQTA